MSGDPRIHARLAAAGSATIHEAYGRRGSLGPEIRPVWAGARLAGPCRTLWLPAGDNLGVHVALDAISPGEVLVVAGSVGAPFGFWGAVLAEYALQRGVAGLVTSLAVRDVDELERLHFPVFARSVSVLGTIKRDPGRHQALVTIGPSVILPGDWIVGDVDGCVVVRADRIEAVLAAADKRTTREAEAIAAIRTGASTREALGYAPPPSGG